MIPWKTVDRSDVPGDEGELKLMNRGTEFSIRTAGNELMNSRIHASEEALAELTYNRIKRGESELKVLIGGLGMGFTLAAALKQSKSDTLITISELIPAVVKWNKEHIGHLAGNPLKDPRVSVKVEDVMKTIGKKKSVWDAIVLDVDNGPDGLTRDDNHRLYGRAGLKTSFSALRSGGILSIWSSGVDHGFTNRLKQCGFKTEIVTVRARKSGKGSRHTIWLAAKPLNYPNGTGGKNRDE